MLSSFTLPFLPISLNSRLALGRMGPCQWCHDLIQFGFGDGVGIIGNQFGRQPRQHIQCLSLAKTGIEKAL